MPEGFGRRGGAQAGRDRHRRAERRRVRQGRQLEPVHSRTALGLRAASHSGRLPARHTGRRPHPLQGVLHRTRRARATRQSRSGRLRRAGEIHRPGDPQARHRELQGRAQGPEGRGSLHAGGGAVERAARPQGRILQDRGGMAHRGHRRDARRVQDDRRCRLRPADRRRALCHRLRPHGAARHVPGLPALAREIRRDAEHTRSKASRKIAFAITSAGAAGPARMSATCRCATWST